MLLLVYVSLFFLRALVLLTCLVSASSRLFTALPSLDRLFLGAFVVAMALLARFRYG
jgi:hypothetical protein